MTSMVTDRIGRREVLLPINQNYNKVREKKLDIGYTFSQKKKTINSTKCATITRAYDAFCPLTQA